MASKTFKQPRVSHRNNDVENLPKICFINPYFGKWPVWIPLFLESCRQNPGFFWFLFGDNKKPEKLPKNVKFLKMSLNDFNKLAKKQTGLPFSIKTPYKICDTKPMYGDIFKNYIGRFAFWGVSDLDIIFGDLESFGIRTKLRNCDIYSPFDQPVGHFTLFRNVEPINKLYLHFENLHLAYQDGPSPLGFDESLLQKIIKARRKLRFLHINYKKELLKKRCETGASIMPSGQIVGELFSANERYLLEKGKTFQLKGKQRREFLYLHFFCWKDEHFWRCYKPNSQPANKFWLDLGGYTPSRKHLLPTNELSRIFRYVVRFTNLITRVKKRLLLGFFLL